MDSSEKVSRGQCSKGFFIPGEHPGNGFKKDRDVIVGKGVQLGFDVSGIHLRIGRKSNRWSTIFMSLGFNVLQLFPQSCNREDDNPMHAVPPIKIIISVG